MTPPTPPRRSSASQLHDSQLHLVQSNSTASIFLGGQRRSWMGAANSSQPPRPPVSHSTSLPAPVVSVPPAASISSAAAPARSSPAQSAPPPTQPPAPPPEHVPHRDNGPAETQRERNSPSAITSPSEQLLSSLNTALTEPSDPQSQAVSTQSRPWVATSSIPTLQPAQAVSQPTRLTPVSTGSSSTPVSATVENAPPPPRGPVASPVSAAQTAPRPLNAPPSRDAVPVSSSALQRDPVTATSTRSTQQLNSHGQRQPPAPSSQAYVNAAKQVVVELMDGISQACRPPTAPALVSPQIPHPMPPSPAHPDAVPVSSSAIWGAPVTTATSTATSTQSTQQLNGRGQRQPQPPTPSSHGQPPTAPALVSPQIPPPMPPSRAPLEHHQYNQLAAAPEQFFQAALKRLYAERQTFVAETENLRGSFLFRACEKNDYLFLAIHQLYCLHDYAPTLLYQLRGFTSLQTRALSTVICSLLAGNRLVSAQFLHLCSNFPLPLPALVQRPDYQAAVNRALACLALLAERWDSFFQHKIAWDLPPFAEEIQTIFGINSPVLGYSIFLAGSRRLHKGLKEDKLREVWNLDLMYYNRRCAMPTSSVAQLERDYEVIIRKYRSLIPATQETRPPTTSAGPQDNRMNGLKTPNPQPPPTTSAGPQENMMNDSNTPNQSPPIPLQLTTHPGTSVASVCARPRSNPPTDNTRPARRSVNGSIATRDARFTNSPTSFVPHMYQPQHPSPQVPANVHATGPVPSRRPAYAPNLGIANHPPMMVNRTQPPPQLGVPRPPVQAPHTKTRSTLLLPPPGNNAPNSVPPHPIRHAIQQSYLGAPCNIVASREAEGENANVVLYLSSFAVAPSPLGKGQCAYQWQFPLSKSAIDRFPSCQSRGVGYRPIRPLVNGSHIYRLRCVRVPPSATEVSEAQWSVAQTCWPSVMYLFVNDVEVFVRRKMQNTKDLPLDITESLREGDNKIVMHFIRGPAEYRDLTYALAIEVLDISDLAGVEPLAQTLPASDSKEQIRKRLAPDTGDDDLSVVSQDLTVNLVDPFSARVFDVPVRGRFCRHQECFDHRTWISTRVFASAKRDLDECWRCPICGQDARPQSLVIDGFLSEVHADLKRTGRLENARAIQIKMDGTWELKTDADSQSPSDRPTNNALGNVKIKRKYADCNDDDQNVFTPVSQKPKLEERPSTQGTARNPPQSPELIVLD